MEKIKEIYELISTPLYIGLGMFGMKMIDWLRFRKKDSGDIISKKIENERSVFDNLENINKNLSRQIDENVEKFLELTRRMQNLLDNNIMLRNELAIAKETNESLRSANAQLKIEVTSLLKDIESLKDILRQTEQEVECLKKYIKDHVN